MPDSYQHAPERHETVRHDHDEGREVLLVYAKLKSFLKDHVDLGNRGKPSFQVDGEVSTMPNLRESERNQTSEPGEFDIPDQVLSMMQDRADKLPQWTQPHKATQTRCTETLAILTFERVFPYVFFLKPQRTNFSEAGYIARCSRPTSFELINT